MPADDEHHLSMQFRYDTFDVGEPKPLHRLRAHTGVRGLGTLLWDSKQVRNVLVDSDQQRRGVATGMWEEAHRLAAENARIPQPKHSSDRTAAGDAWARSVGGRLPRKKQ